MPRWIGRDYANTILRFVLIWNISILLQISIFFIWDQLKYKFSPHCHQAITWAKITQFTDAYMRHQAHASLDNQTDVSTRSYYFRLNLNSSLILVCIINPFSLSSSYISHLHNGQCPDIFLQVYTFPMCFGICSAPTTASDWAPYSILLCSILA